MLPSAAGYAEIEKSEGWSSGPYWDTIGKVWTAWFGETNGVGPHSPRLTVTQGRTKLHRRFERDYAPALKPFEKLPGFTQHMYDALASFVWNCGIGAVGKSTRVGRSLRARDWGDAADALLAWCRDGDGDVVDGLLTRRKREREMFLTPSLAIRQVRLDVRQKEHVDTLRRERRIAARHGGFGKIHGSHKIRAEASKRWLLLQATAYEKRTVLDVGYQRRKVAFLRDVAHDRNGLGR